MGHVSLPYRSTLLPQALNTFLQFKNDIALFVSIGKSSWKAFQADRIWTVTASVHPLAYPMMSPTVSNSSPSIVMHLGKGSSASTIVEQVLQMKYLQFLNLSLTPEHSLCTYFLQLKQRIEPAPTPIQDTPQGNRCDRWNLGIGSIMSRAYDLCLPNIYLNLLHFQPFLPVL